MASWPVVGVNESPTAVMTHHRNLRKHECMHIQYAPDSFKQHKNSFNSKGGVKILYGFTTPKIVEMQIIEKMADRCGERGRKHTTMI